jgi:hypothetical protein
MLPQQIKQRPMVSTAPESSGSARRRDDRKAGTDTGEKFAPGLGGQTPARARDPSCCRQRLSTPSHVHQLTACGLAYGLLFQRPLPGDRARVSRERDHLPLA